MLEDFVSNDDKPTPPKGGEVIQPNSSQADNPSPQPPQGPYRPAILNKQSAETKQEEKTTSDKEINNSDEQSMKPQQTAKKPKPKSKVFLIVFTIILIVGGAGAAVWWFLIKDNNNTSSTANNTSSQQTTTKTTAPTSKLVMAPLSGLDVEADIANRPVTSIMIENSEEARPQSGLMDADVVFEAIAEGGITRFLALFQSKSPEYIGPIRSARPYYVEWAKTFDASYVHAGGSPDGLKAIGDLGVKDLSAFAFGEDVFYRTSDRQSPHNLYSSFKGLDKINKEKGFTTSKFTAWNRKKDVPQTPSAKTIDITISSPYYNPSYTYDSATNSYLRSEGGETHNDEKSKKQLAPKTVLVMVMDRSQSGIYSIYKTSGSGKFLAFQDGVISEGTWSRNSTTEQYSFKDSNGFDFLFNKGQTWVSIVTDATNVKYSK